MNKEMNIMSAFSDLCSIVNATDQRD